MTTVLKAKLLAGIFLVAMAIAAPAQTVSTIYKFSSGTNPNLPAGVMAQGQDGNFYGITLSGGGPANQGAIYKISPKGVLTSLHAMADSDGTTCSGLTLGTDGNFYGTCHNGGANDYGTLFKVTSAGALTVLHNFAAQGSTSDGCEPLAPPIQASNGDFYGTTSFCGANNYGTVYKLTLAGAYSLLYSFQGPPDDTLLPLGLIEADGELWGVGNGWIISGGGIFKITLAGKESLVYTFKANSDGAYPDGEYPSANLIQGSNGDFYGTTEEGGTANEGTIFEVTAAGKETVLYSFPNQTDGAYPSLPLTQGPNGLLFGAATDCAGGGCSQAGLFDITTAGAYKNLYLYPLVCSNCGQPEAPLLLSTNGTFYSTTEQGGIGVGSFYSLNDGYSPFISLVNVTSGAEGAQVGILGQGFSSKSVVEFGGTKATTTKLTGTTYILATVPAGALTGDITVTTGSTKLSTTASYKITPTYKSFAPLSGPVGTVVTFNGTGLTQTTKVTIDKISTSFTVVSDSEITAAVPAGAATGKIVVTTKGGGVTSSTNFTVN
ncbi:MAG: choice-of-anchor tandem repeat GloVer-containing protein [Candidatus Sulfotelmatobacter sp.]